MIPLQTYGKVRNIPHKKSELFWDQAQDQLYHKGDDGIMYYISISSRENISGLEWIKGDKGKVVIGENYALEMVQRKMDCTVILEGVYSCIKSSKV